jgi:hypothetical protein
MACDSFGFVKNLLLAILSSEIHHVAEALYAAFLENSITSQEGLPAAVIDSRRAIGIPC